MTGSMIASANSASYMISTNSQVTNMISTKNRTYSIPREIVLEFDAVCETESVNKSKLVTKLVTEWVQKKRGDTK